MCIKSHEHFTRIARTCNEIRDGKPHIRMARTCHELGSAKFTFEKSISGSSWACPHIRSSDRLNNLSDNCSGGGRRTLPGGDGRHGLPPLCPLRPGQTPKHGGKSLPPWSRTTRGIRTEIGFWPLLSSGTR